MQRLTMLLKAENYVTDNLNKFEKFDERGQKIK